MLHRYRFQSYAFVEVTADNVEDAQKLLRTWNGHDKCFTTVETFDGGKSIFSFSTAYSKQEPEEVRE